MSVEPWSELFNGKSIFGTTRLAGGFRYTKNAVHSHSAILYCFARFLIRENGFVLEI